MHHSTGRAARCDGLRCRSSLANHAKGVSSQRDRFIDAKAWVRFLRWNQRLFDQQSLGISQISSIKPFCKPAVNLRKHLLCFRTLALLSPQARKARLRT
jgi:hypothetical protein